MKYGTIIFVLIAIAAVESAAGQKKSVGNADLEKYRQARLTAEREYRENHVRLGLPSPEEIDRRNEASRKSMMEVSEKLRAEEIERDRIAFEAASAPVVVVNNDRERFVDRGYGIAPAYIWSQYGNGWYRRPIRQIGPQQRYYISGGSLWPIGSPVTVRPPFRGKRK